MDYMTLYGRMRAAVNRLYPGMSRDWDWIKELPYDPMPGDEIVDRWHSWWNKKGEKRYRERHQRNYKPLPTNIAMDSLDDLPF